MTAHLDDERLSAYLDGDEPTAAAHLEACDDCRARLDAFRAVAAAVAAPVPPVDAERRDAAIAAALAAPAASADNVVPLRPPARRPFALGAAALLMVVLVAVTVLSKDDDRRDRAALSSPDMQTLSDEASGGVPDGGDLGDQSDPTALATRLRAVLEPPPDAADAAGGGGATASGDSGAAASKAPAVAKAESQAQESRRTDGKSFSTGAPDCTATVAREYGNGLGPLAYRASLRWEGTPAVVLVYPITGATGGLDRRVLVMAQGDCRLLVAQTI